MITNGALTIYHREYNSETRLDEWKREIVQSAWWFTSEKSVMNTDGLIQQDVTTIRIPVTDTIVSKEDYIVKGECTIKMQTLKDLVGTEYIKVTSVNKNDFGSNPHIKVVGV